MTGKIFLNYRRADADAWADRIYERLVQDFPRDNVFMDIDGNIPVGFPWVDWLDQQVAECDLMLVLIGRNWVAEFDAREAGGQRDFVKVEIERALARGIPVVPVRLYDAPEPSPSSLPPTVCPLLDRQAVHLPRLGFDKALDELVEGVVRSIQLSRGEVSPATAQPEPPTALAGEEQYRAEGRIHIDAPIIHGAPDGWFKPGAGKIEWFQDIENGPEMVVVPAGSFMRGSPESEPGRYDDEGPQRTVSISSPFAISRHAITFDQWDAAVSGGGCNGYSPADMGWGRGNLPVIDVDWEDARAYASWLSGKTGQTYRLLSEAEWEHAARAGTTTPFWWGSSITASQANYNNGYTDGDGSKEENRQRTMPVESFEPNPWGLYQVHGNVWEWCEDQWHDTYNGAPSDGSAWVQGEDTSRRVVRGGSWVDIPDNLRSANRGWFTSVVRYLYLGFRLARTLNP